MSGWGFFNYAAEHARGLQKLSLPILSKEKCKSITVLHSQDYYRTKMGDGRRTLCAGYENRNFFNFRQCHAKNKFLITEEKGPCNGDSGGPLVIRRGDRYFLRGIVSESVSHPNDTAYCNTNYPAIFTDVALYRTWIKKATGQELLNYDTASRDF
jgi:Trypsin